MAKDAGGKAGGDDSVTSTVDPTITSELKRVTQKDGPDAVKAVSKKAVAKKAAGSKKAVSKKAVSKKAAAKNTAEPKKAASSSDRKGAKMPRVGSSSRDAAAKLGRSTSNRSTPSVSPKTAEAKAETSAAAPTSKPPRGTVANGSSKATAPEPNGFVESVARRTGDLGITRDVARKPAMDSATKTPDRTASAAQATTSATQTTTQPTAKIDTKADTAPTTTARATSTAVDAVAKAAVEDTSSAVVSAETDGQAPPIPVVPVLEMGRLVTYLVILGVFTIVSAFSALALSRSQPEVFGAQTDILFELDSDLASGFLREDRRLTTQVVTIESRAVLGPAAADLGVEVDELSDNLQVEVVEGSEVIRLVAKGQSGDEALQRLDVVVDTYLSRLAAADSSSATLELIDAELDDLAGRDAELQAQIDRLSRQVEAGQSDPQVAVLLSDLEALRARRSGLETQRSQQELNDLIKPRFTVLTPSFVLDEPLEPKPLQAAALGALIGALIGAAVIFVIERSKPGLR